MRNSSIQDATNLQYLQILEFGVDLNGSFQNAVIPSFLSTSSAPTQISVSSQ